MTEKKNLRREIISQVLEEEDLNYSELSRGTGIPVYTLQKFFAGKITDLKADWYAPIADFLNLTLDQLYGRAPLPEKFSKTPQKQILSSSAKLIPVIDQAMAATWNDKASEQQNLSWLTVTIPVSDKAFAIKISDDKAAPAIPGNSIIVVDPEIEITDKACIVIAANGEIAMKGVSKELNVLYLHPLNPSFKTFTFDPSLHQFIGTIVEVILKYK